MPEYVGFVVTLTVVILIVIGIWLLPQYWQNTVVVRKLRLIAKQMGFKFQQEPQRKREFLETTPYRHWTMVGKYKQHNIIIESCEQEKIPLIHKLLLKFQTATYLSTSIQVYHNKSNKVTFELRKNNIPKIFSFLGINETAETGIKSFDNEVTFDIDNLKGIKLDKDFKKKSDEIVHMLHYHHDITITNKYIELVEQHIIKSENTYRTYLDQLCSFSDILDSYNK